MSEAIAGLRFLINRVRVKRRSSCNFARGWLFTWEMDLESRSLAGPALDLNFAAVGFYDPIANRQAQPQAASFFGGKKRLKDLR